MRILGIIPARYKSSRLEGKPLADICGKPMIWWVYENAKKVKLLDDVIVATDDERIVDVCKSYDINCIMTSSKHPTGSDRASEVATKVQADIYVTIQGDEPLLETKTIEHVIDILLNDTDVKCATLRVPYKKPIDVINRTTPKVVCNVFGDILLISRAEIPYPHKSLDYDIYKPIGTYAWRRDTLLQYGKLERGPVELAEDSELIRLIEHGISVRTEIVESETISVDTEKDLERVRNIVSSRKMEG